MIVGERDADRGPEVGRTASYSVAPQWRGRGP
jgi:hypothetical protein